MTPRQSQLLAFLRERALAGDVMPSFEEMSAHMNLSRSGVHRIVVSLERRGHIVRGYRNSSRSITTTGITEYQRGYRDGLAAAAQERAA